MWETNIIIGAYITQSNNFISFVLFFYLLGETRNHNSSLHSFLLREARWPLFTVNYGKECLLAAGKATTFRCKGSNQYDLFFWKPRYSSVKGLKNKKREWDNEPIVYSAVAERKHVGLLILKSCAVHWFVYISAACYKSMSDLLHQIEKGRWHAFFFDPPSPSSSLPHIFFPALHNWTHLFFSCTIFSLPCSLFGVITLTSERGAVFATTVVLRYPAHNFQ